MDDQQPDWVELFKSYCERHGGRFYAPVNVSRAEAEEALGMQFPLSYLAFVDRLRAGGVPLGDVIDAYYVEALPLRPKWLVPFFYDGLATCHAFDRRSPLPEGEYRVVAWDYELTWPENVDRMGDTEETFPQWVERYAREELSDEDVGASGSGCVGAVCLAVFPVVVGAVAIWNWIWGVE